MPCLEVSHLRKQYGELTVVDDLSLEVADGEIFGLIGPNGAGKSTTIGMILGLVKADSGSVLLQGQPYDPRDPDQRASFGVVPQELAIYPDLSATQNLRFFGRINGLSGRRLRDRVDYVLDLTGLAQNAAQTPRTFSGGMSRRLNFGISLLQEPRFVVLDEPTVGIDPQSRARLLGAVQDLARTGVGILYASHYMEEVEELCDRVAIIDRGRLLREGTLDELLDQTRQELHLTVANAPRDLESQLSGLAEVSTNPDGSTSIVVRVELTDQDTARPRRLCRVLEVLDSGGVSLLGIDTRETNLESLFLRLTGRTLRD